MINVGIVSVNAEAAAGEAFDTSGPAVRSCLLPDSFNIKELVCVAPDKGFVQAILEKWCRPESEIHLIITTGGTGLGPTDVTPEAISELISLSIPGIPEAIRAACMARSPRAMLSRAVAGIRNRTLIVSIQGNPHLAREAMQVIVPALKHAVATIREEPVARAA